MLPRGCGRGRVCVCLFVCVCVFVCLSGLRRMELAFSSAQLKYGKTTAGSLVDAALLAQLVEMG